MVSGPGLARDCDGPDAWDAAAIPARAVAGDERAQAALERHADRLARGLAQIINVLDPDAIVLGGGLSNMEHLYTRIPALLPRHVFSDVCATPVLRNRHGDSSGCAARPGFGRYQNDPSAVPRLFRDRASPGNRLRRLRRPPACKPSGAVAPYHRPY